MSYSYTITRTLDAPVAKVWQAWTDPEHYVWSGAKPGTIEMDVRPGGAWKSVMMIPGGAEIPLTGSYLEVEEGRRLVVGMDVPGGEPEAMVLELTPQGGQTKITLFQESGTEQGRDMSQEGSDMLLDWLTEYLARS